MLLFHDLDSRMLFVFRDSGSVPSFFAFGSLLAWFPFLHRFNFFISFLLLLLSDPSWSCLSSSLMVMNSHWNCEGNGSMMTIQWWIIENCKEIKERLLNSDEFWWIGELGFEIFLCSWWFLDFDLTEWREKVQFCLWCGVWSMALWSWLVQWLHLL